MYTAQNSVFNRTSASFGQDQRLCRVHRAMPRTWHSCNNKATLLKHVGHSAIQNDLIHMHVCRMICMCMMCTYAYVYSYVCMCVYICLCVCVYIYIYIYICTYVYIYIYACMHACMYVCMYVCILGRSLMCVFMITGICMICLICMCV
jgi:hypothetical protein